jgi:hypothetical protein
MDTFEDDALLVRRNPLVLASAAAPLAAGGALACTAQPSAIALGLALVWIGLGGFLYAWARSPLPRERVVRVRADQRGLAIDGRVVFDAAHVRAGWLETRPHAAGPVVHLRARAGLRLSLEARGVDVVVRDVQGGRALLRALDVDPTSASSQYWVLARPLGEPRAFARAATLVALVLAFAVVASQCAPAALALAVVTLVVAFVGITVPTHVTVGADGILLRWLGTMRFVSWADVAAMEDFDGGVVIALDGGEWLTLRTPADHERHHPEREAMIERMRVAWWAHPRSGADETAASLVRRTGGRTREWVRAVRALVRREGGYRVAGVPPERLWRVAEDASADRSARTGAALALAPTLDEPGRRRMTALASSCAEPRLRTALTMAAGEAAADAPDEEIASALDASEGEGEEEAESSHRKVSGTP